MNFSEISRVFSGLPYPLKKLRFCLIYLSTRYFDLPRIGALVLARC